MALLRIDFFSEVLEVGASMDVVWPQPTELQVGVSGGRDTSDGPPVLYLLHGRTDDHTAWTRNSSIERYAVAAGVAVVMPAARRSFYTDEVHGDRFWTFLSEELPTLVESMFRVSGRREDTFVAGLSMGGYGAMKWALRAPHRFAAAATLSGALDIQPLLSDPERREELIDRVFGPELDPQEDLFALLGSAERGSLPMLHVSCGTEDHLADHSRRFAAAAADAGADVTLDLRPGEHEWGFWDTEIQHVLDWLPLGPTASLGP